MVVLVGGAASDERGTPVHGIQPKVATQRLGGRGPGGGGVHGGTSLVRTPPLLGPYSRPMPRALGGWEFLMSQVSLRRALLATQEGTSSPDSLSSAQSLTQVIVAFE